MTRGILYIVWDGKEESPKLLGRSIDSVKQYHPDLPIEVVTLDPSADLLDKSKMLDLSPFDTTLFLDADTVVLGDLTFGFGKAELHGIACCICECPWAKRYEGLSDCGDMIEYNTGVIFFSKHLSIVHSTFGAWQALCRHTDSRIVFETQNGVKYMPLNDQCGFARAMEGGGEFHPFVLPLNWNYRPAWQKTYFGEMKIWHDMRPVPDYVIERNRNQQTELIGCAEVPA